MSEKDKLQTLMLVLMPFLALLSSFTCQKLWLWFVVPLGVIPISLVHAMGLGVLVSYIKVEWTGKIRDDDEETIKNKIISYLFGPIIFLSIGYVVKLFM